MKSFVKCSLPSLLIIAVLASVASAQEMTTDQILDRYVEVTGGADAYKKIKSRVQKATLEVVGMGLTGTVEEYGAAPNLAFQKVVITGMSEETSGSDGTTHWSSNSMMGTRVLEGKELATSKRMSDFFGPLNWKKQYKTIKLAGSEKVGENECYKLEMIPEDGASQTWYFDKKTGLQNRVLTTSESPMGEIAIKIDLMGYRAIDGVKVPHHVRMDQGGMATIEMKVTEIKTNVEIPASRFKLPADVQKLVEKKKKALAAPKKAATQPGQ